MHMLLLIFFLGAAQLPSFRDTYLSPASSTFARGCERACFARGLCQQSGEMKLALLVPLVLRAHFRKTRRKKKPGTCVMLVDKRARGSSVIDVPCILFLRLLYSIL